MLFGTRNFVTRLRVTGQGFACGRGLAQVGTPRGAAIFPGWGHPPLFHCEPRGALPNRCRRRANM